MEAGIPQAQVARMKAITLLYHDVVGNGDYRASGFDGGDADLYKLDVALFESHLDAIARVCPGPLASAPDLLAENAATPRLLLTFDDGGASAYDVIAGLLERRGWRGCFFIATDFIGRPAFVNAQQLRDLRARGHIIGSHSASHPHRISHLPEQQLFDEWRRSTTVLHDILGSAVEFASVPCGDYSPAVARATARAGIRMLFNSEPTTRIRQVEGCRVAGRFGLQRNDSPQTAAALAAAARGPRMRQWVSWNVRKAVKASIGESYLTLRKRLLSR
jgi:peptidoglycan/xylan/chitin deacetylase (PgdA/CDA1 family)